MSATRNATRLRQQVKLEQLGFWRNPDYAFFTFFLPMVLLATLGTINQGDTISGRTDIKAINFVVPGILGFAIVVASYANLATRLAVLRSDAVLKRVRTTPLQPSVYLGGHLLSTLLTSLLSAGCTVALGAAVFDVHPRWSGIPVLIAGLVLGIVCFAALGLAVSSFIPHADAAGPITNGTYLPLALISGVFDPTIDLPSWLDHVVAALPIRPLYEVLSSAYDPRASGFPHGVYVLLGWTVVSILLAVRTFRWTPRRS